MKRAKLKVIAHRKSLLDWFDPIRDGADQEHEETWPGSPRLLLLLLLLLISQNAGLWPPIKPDRKKLRNKTATLMMDCAWM